MNEVSTRGQTRLNRNDWIKAAVDVMVSSGVEQVRVEKLAVTLGVSRGSFYWHFKDRAELLSAILDEWRDRATGAVQKRLAAAETLPHRRLLMFMELPLRSDAALHAADLELAIIAWARNANEVRQMVEMVDKERTQSVIDLFVELGVALDEAELRAHEVYAFLRYMALRRDIDISHRTQLTRRLHSRLTADLVKPQ